MDLNDITRMSPQAQRQIMDKLGAAMKSSKYSNRKTKVGELTFDSKKEADCFRELVLLQRSGKIRRLKIQPEYTLQEAYTDFETGEHIRAIRYRADFSYERKTKTDQNGECYWISVVVDVKSPATRTRVYLNKRKMMQERFGITVVEV